MKYSHQERWFKYRIADMVGVFLSCLILVFLIDFNETSKGMVLLGSPIFFVLSMVFWYAVTLYFPLRLLELLFKIKGDDRVVRFLLEPGFMLAHAVVVFNYLNGDLSATVSQAVFLFTGVTFISNLFTFWMLEKENIALFNSEAKI